MDITQLRLQIDDVDAQIMALFTRRMAISAQIAEYKKENALPVHDPAREQEKARALGATVPSELTPYAEALYAQLAQLSRAYQIALGTSEVHK